VEYETITDLPDDERQIVGDFKTRGITIRVHKLGDEHFACRAKYKDRDSKTTYARTPGKAVHQTADLVRKIWPDVF